MDSVNRLLPGEELKAGFTPFPNPNYKEAGIEWWTPQTAQIYWGLHAIRNNKVYEILVDATDEHNQYLIYMRVYEI